MAGAVLAGGASRRMGAPKALVRVDGTPMAARAAGALVGAGASPVALVGGDPAWATELALVALADRWPGAGPLGGLATALLDLAVGGDRPVVLVAACDQPWLDHRELAALVDALVADPDVEAAVGTVGGRAQPLPAAWRVTAGPRLRCAVEGGERRLTWAVSSARVAEVPLSAASVADVDRPGDLERPPPG